MTQKTTERGFLQAQEYRGAAGVLEKEGVKGGKVRERWQVTRQSIRGLINQRKRWYARLESPQNKGGKEKRQRSAVTKGDVGVLSDTLIVLNKTSRRGTEGETTT